MPESARSSANGPSDSPASSRHRVVQSLGTLLIVVVFLSVAAMVAGLLGRWHFLFDLASHFRVQATVAVLGSGVLMLPLRRTRAACISLLIGLLLAISLLPHLWPAAAAVGGPTYRLMTANVLTSNSNRASLLRLIQEVDPDFVLLQETDQAWTNFLEQNLRAQYPFRQLVPREDNFGIAMFSKHPWLKCETIELTQQTQLPSLTAHLQLPNQTKLRLIATHPLPPMRRLNWRDRNQSFQALATDVREHGSERTIIAGDLNCTPWSYWFRRLLRESQLRDSSRGHGLAATWKPFRLPLSGLLIDHILVGSRIEVVGRFIGPHIGSDHRPVIVDFR